MLIRIIEMKIYVVILVCIFFCRNVAAQDPVVAFSLVSLVDLFTKDKALPLYNFVNYNLSKSQKKDKSRQIETLNLQLFKHRDSAVLYLQRGILRQQLFLNDAAIQDFNNAIRNGITKISTEVYFHYAKAALGQGYRSMGISAIDKYISSNPDSSKGFLCKGIVLTYTMKSRMHSFESRCREAIPEFTKAIERDESCWLAYILRAHAYHFLNQFDQSASDYRSAINLTPDHPGLYFLLANVYEDNGDKPLACSNFQKVRALQADLPERFIKRNCD